MQMEPASPLSPAYSEIPDGISRVSEEYEHEFWVGFGCLSVVGVLIL